MMTNSDRRLLQALQTDVTQSQVDLAATAGLSRTSCWRRVRELEKSGLIRQKVALLDPKLAGFGIEVLLLVAMTEHTDENRRDFESHVRGLAHVLECFSVSGERDYMLQVVAKDMDSYTDFLNSQILKHPAVRSASSTFVLKRVKYSTALPVSE
ncbi:MAG: Lrp/AsnC family transcriptional regulator [Gammaproteobacteria bacterium]|nr:MAG: Lrp/AsnC family transcriptional regulator [Gammaproteobacteria bacterium]